MFTNFLAFIFVLGVLVFVHELGHFLVARWHGVRVLTFSLGFGPRLFSTRRGDTEYCISIVPLGGYVKMAGENPDEPRSGASDEFMSKTKWQRFQVYVAGPAMNIALALVVMTFVLYSGAEAPAYEEQPAVIGSVTADSPAARAGLQKGDRIVAVAGKPVATWEQLFLTVMPRAEREIPVEFERAGARQTVQITPEAQTKFQMGDIGVAPETHPQIRELIAGGAAEKAGLQAGDVMMAVDGAPVTSDRDLVKTINDNAGKALSMQVKRQGRLETIAVTPVLDGGLGKIGVRFAPFEVRTIEPSFTQAIGLSAKQNLQWSTMIFEAVIGLVKGETSPKQLMGPVAIAQLSGGAARVSWVALFGLMAMISLNLGILNLLPIPVLDGGHIFIMAVEGLFRRDFSIAVKEKMLLAGFVVLMALMVTVIYNDLMRIEWIERLVPWR
ncbi:MAG: RIP metalloprotease RseP [Acidobacteria bacterium]|nr:RIP metalloprotease RseP [Acidobacteriota bacterium]